LQLVWSWTQAGVLIQVTTGTSPPLLPLPDARGTQFELLCGAADVSTGAAADAATSAAALAALQGELHASAAKADAAVAGKRDTEAELYRQFALVLNVKKGLIRTLTEDRDTAAAAEAKARARVARLEARLEARRGAVRTAEQDEEDDAETSSDGRTPNASDDDGHSDGGGGGDDDEEEEAPIQLTQPRRQAAAAAMPPPAASRLPLGQPAARGVLRFKAETSGGAPSAQPARKEDSGASQRARTQSVRALTSHRMPACSQPSLYGHAADCGRVCASGLLCVLRGAQPRRCLRWPPSSRAPSWRWMATRRTTAAGASDARAPHDCCCSKGRQTLLNLR
jgi:hypothetical protein